MIRTQSLASQNTLISRIDLLLILVFAITIRLVTYNGAFGSDDLTYFTSAKQLASGDWSAANYNGALRYGFNIPTAGFIVLFGSSLFVANMWPLLCSLIEIVAVYLFGNTVMNRRTGIFSALLMASAPLHIAVSTRIHADPVVSMFLTCSFVLLYFGLLQEKKTILFGAGIAIGGIFWSKELAAVTWFAFLPLLWFCRDRWRIVAPVIAGLVLMLVLHGILMTIIAGDPFHLIRVVLKALKHNFVDGGQGEDGAIYYLRYLFIDIRHTGLMGVFLILAFLMLPQWLRRSHLSSDGILFLIIWWVSLLLVLSLFPVSLSPLRLTMKQSNYITLFLAPTALLSGMALAALPKAVGQFGLVTGVAIGALLGAFQQADYRSFTANSKAVADFALSHPEAMVVGSTNNSRLGALWANLEHPKVPKADIVSFRDLNDQSNVKPTLRRQSSAIYAVLDRQTVNWFPASIQINNALPCWNHVMTLTPSDLGVGNRLALLLSSAMTPFASVVTALDHLAKPKQADVYRVSGSDVFCRGG